MRDVESAAPMHLGSPIPPRERMSRSPCSALPPPESDDGGARSRHENEQVASLRPESDERGRLLGVCHTPGMRGALRALFHSRLVTALMS